MKYKTYLCIEHGEEFTVKAHDIQHARDQASMWGGECIRELKPQRKPKKAATDSAALDRFKKQHVEVIKEMLHDFIEESPADNFGRVTLSLDAKLWKKHCDLQWKIFMKRGGGAGACLSK